MRLYLVQHGKSMTKESDPERPLTEEGAKEVDAVAAYLSGKVVGIEAVWHSGKTRALQTAERLAARLAEGMSVDEWDGLGPMDDVEPLIETLEELDEDLMIVGHLPFLAKLASILLCFDQEAGIIAFYNAGVVCLDRDEEGEWQLAWAITPELV